MNKTPQQKDWRSDFMDLLSTSNVWVNSCYLTKPSVGYTLSIYK
jgi:hypothetical protein